MSAESFRGEGARDVGEPRARASTARVPRSTCGTSCTSRPAEAGEPLVTVEGEGSDEIPQDSSHLALRAFALAAPLEGHSFHFVNRIPLERGLGSSAATVAAGLVAGLAVAGRDTSLEDVLELGLPLEGHADNLAAALAGGVCLIWRSGERHRVERIATEMPLAPIVLVPETRVNTKESRSRLPEFVRHDVASAAAAQAALLGAAIAAGNADLLAAAFHDVLHEPYRAQDAPLLEELRLHPVGGHGRRHALGLGPVHRRLGAQGGRCARRRRARSPPYRRPRASARDRKSRHPRRRRVPGSRDRGHG